jgi:hypothetical protein
MGMYDEVQIKCPKCPNEIVFQSKAGPCDLNIYTPYNAPLGVLEDLEKCTNITCLVCGHELKIVVQKIVIVL